MYVPEVCTRSAPLPGLLAWAAAWFLFMPERHHTRSLLYTSAHTHADNSGSQNAMRE